jgi:multidrug efflux system membrane fusion protein
VVADSVEYTGRTDAVQSVGIRARVTGYLMKVPFKEDAEVKKDDLLFDIDPRPYQTLVDQAKAQIGVSEALVKYARANRERAQIADDKGADSKQSLDQAVAYEEEVRAEVRAYKANLEATELNLSFTRVSSPIDGQISRYYYTPGNLINQDQTLLTTVVSTDPMYVYFDVDERTLLRLRNALRSGKLKTTGDGIELPVSMALDGEDGFPTRGPSTSPTTWSIRPPRLWPSAGCFPTPSPPAARASSRPACSFESGSRSAIRARLCSWSIGPSGRTRG